MIPELTSRIPKFSSLNKSWVDFLILPLSREGQAMLVQCALKMLRWSTSPILSSLTSFTVIQQLLVKTWYVISRVTRLNLFKCWTCLIICSTKKKNYSHNWSCCLLCQESAVKISQVMYRNISGTSKTPKAMKFACSDTVPCSNIVLANINLERDNGTAETFCNCAMGFDYGTVNPSAECLHDNTCDGSNRTKGAQWESTNYIHTELWLLRVDADASFRFGRSIPSGTFYCWMLISITDKVHTNGEE